eukprot:scaffold85495_cov32-Tisochrysis_lutea.AAC.3
MDDALGARLDQPQPNVPIQHVCLFEQWASSSLCRLWLTRSTRSTCTAWAVPRASDSKGGRSYSSSHQRRHILRSSKAAASDPRSFDLRHSSR